MTNDTIEWRVRDLSLERRAVVKARLVEELLRQNRRHRRLRIAVGATVAAATASAITAMALLSPSTATAAWNAVPTPLPISLQDPMVLRCLADLPTAPPDQNGWSKVTTVVAESRGSSRAALLEGEDSQGVCVTTPSSRSGGRTDAPPLRAGQDMSLTGNGGGDGGRIWFAIRVRSCFCPGCLSYG